ncbi:MAG TPA: nickel pincer cofactor biosynthesis protein LarC [Anaerolineales bacterium]
MKIAYFDCIAGASGDMILGALIDAGLSLSDLQERLSALHLPGFELHSRKVVKSGISATKVDIVATDELTERRLPEILEVIDKSNLSAVIQQGAKEIFKNLGAVEAEIHGTEIDEVHMHELGGLDTIIDVVGALVGLKILGVERVYASPLPLGRGFTRSAHGTIPLPAPAAVALLHGIPVVGSDLEFEMVTPTGAAILTHIAHGFGSIPEMKLLSSGYGAGGRDLPIPNVLRVLLGEEDLEESVEIETLALLETNIDDLNPEIYDHVMARLFSAGALDVTLSPLQMKKNRPATQLAVLCRPEDTPQLSDILFAETSTLGVRKQLVERHSLARVIKVVNTPYGPVRVKLASWRDKVKATPEYDDCRELAKAKGIPLRDIYQAAELAAQSIKPGQNLGGF